MSELRWYPGPCGEWSAWTTTEGEAAGFAFTIGAADPGFISLKIAGTAPLEILRISFEHRGFTVDAVKRFAEGLRAILPATPAGEQWATVDEILTAAQQRRRHVARCRFVHAFPLIAGDNDICYCGGITKGFYEAQEAKR